MVAHGPTMETSFDANDFGHRPPNHFPQNTPVNRVLRRQARSITRAIFFRREEEYPDGNLLCHAASGS